MDKSKIESPIGKKEVRFTLNETHFDSEKNTVEGYAAVFGVTSVNLGGFVEVIDANAFTGVIERSDVVALFEHTHNNGVLARCKKGTGTLTLKIDEKGLKFSFQLGNTSLANDMKEYLTRGDIDSCSFAFSVNLEEWDMKSKPCVRNVKQVGYLFDISMVVYPAYVDTSVALRSMPKEIQPQTKTAIEVQNHINKLFN